jgi:hypothetical protein
MTRTTDEMMLQMRCEVYWAIDSFMTECVTGIEDLMRRSVFNGLYGLQWRLDVDGYDIMGAGHYKCWCLPDKDKEGGVLSRIEVLLIQLFKLRTP